MERDLEVSQENFLEGLCFCNVLDLKDFSRLKVIVPKTN